MRLFQVSKSALKQISTIVLFCTILSPVAFSQMPDSPAAQALAGQLGGVSSGFPDAARPPGSGTGCSAETAKDPESACYKAMQLSELSKRKPVPPKDPLQKDDFVSAPIPAEMVVLQDINEFMGGGNSPLSVDDPIQSASALDLRKDAQKEAALSYGARGGLAKRNYQIVERMRGFGPSLDKVFNFRSLLIQASSGLLVEPPIIKEALNALIITDKGNEAAVADEVYDINKQAKIVSAPRDWRQYLLQSWSEVPPPPRILWPKNRKEQKRWNMWVRNGWQAGVEQADQIFEASVNKLLADYRGMVRYRMLLAQNMISKPYTLHEDRGVTGDKNQMRVGDRALRITGPSQFLMGANLWKPADR